MRLASALLAAALVAPVAQAANLIPPSSETRGVAVAFGNTVKALYPDGRYERIWFHADGAWEAVGRRGSWSSGKWSLKDDNRVCLKQARPFPVPFKYCTTFPAQAGLGDVWRSKDMSGEPIEVTVVRGIERPMHGAGS
jgi:hypothetical protein